MRCEEAEEGKLTVGSQAQLDDRKDHGDDVDDAHESVGHFGGLMVRRIAMGMGVISD